MGKRLKLWVFLLIAIFVCGGLVWYFLTMDYVEVTSGKNIVIFKNARGVGKADLNVKDIKSLLDDLNLKNQNHRIVFDFKKYEDLEFDGKMVLMKGSLQSVRAMFCDNPVVGKNGEQIVSVYVSPEAFRDKFGGQIALERENNLVLLCLIKSLNTNMRGSADINIFVTEMTAKKNYSVVRSLKI